ncbi:hypothetical protein U9M48_020766 [Paspalum notatum var. saurae]|uniref:Receptor kinase-like protein Xa21 n=1 Tax=Paspalum notatum var. saurae TaxID=547442 RepID=A0AAQ3WSZ4_PASNO
MQRVMSLLPAAITIMIAVAFSSRGAHGSVGGDEASALLAFRDGLTRSSSGVLAGWNGTTGVCSWEGVSCSSGQVVALSLPSYGLAGVLSPDIGNLTSLRTLNLSSNGFHGDIPASIGRLVRLQLLDLSYNALSGTLFANLSSCVSLRFLRLSSNQFHGSIPAELGSKLTNLQRFSLSNNSLTGAIPGSLGSLSSLNYLDLSSNQLEGPIPPELGSIPGLQVLFLSINNLSGVLPHSLYNLSTLETLGVAYNMLSGTIAADIGDRFPRMKTLSFSANQFSGSTPPSISNLSALTKLGLDVNYFTGYVPPDLGKLQNLTDLYLDSNRLEANDNQGWEFITSLTNCSQLQHLVLGNNSFSGKLPGSIVNLSTTLQTLYLGDNRISGAIPSNIGNLVGLIALEMANSSIYGAIPESIGMLENLVELGLYSTSLSGLIPPSLGNLTQLNRLYAYYGNLEGPIPASLGNLKNLFVLDLSTNRLNGSIPREVLKLPQLSFYLDLSYNSLSGPLPTEVGSLANLNQLILSGNQLSGTIPDSIGNCISLERLLLDHNLFEGTIPQSLKSLKGLALLNLTMNRLSGSIPDALASIDSLQQLYLAQNNFSGIIPTVLQNLTMLSKLDLSFNDLQGEVPKEGVFANATALSINGNDKLCGGASQLHLPPCSIPAVEKNKRHLSRSLVVTLTSICALVFLGIVAALIHLIQKRFRQRKASQFISIEIDEPYERVSYHALSSGTGGFSEANLLGQGSYGAVYKCTLHGQGTTTAVKVFNIRQSGSTRSFVAECEALRKVRHRCLIKIITCCSSIDPHGQEFKALVFEFMPNGSLNDWLHPGSKTHTLSNTLSLSQRLDIAVDIMDALDYLHNQCQPPVIHCDLKPSNILLAEDMSARVGDFGISKILPDDTCKTLLNSISFTGLRGSIGYVPPEYGEGRSVSTLGDVYSLGILLLEMFTGRSPTDDMFKDSLDLHKYAEAALPNRALEIADHAIWLHEEAKEKDLAPARAATLRSRSEGCLALVIRLAVSCSKQQPRERMAIRDAAVEMRSIRDANAMLFATVHPNSAMAMRTMSLLPAAIAVVIAVAFSSWAAHGSVGDEASALLAFKAGLAGRNSSALASRNGTTGVCGWEGVACSGSQVVALSLASYGLAGVLSLAIGNLTSLRTLNLSSNRFHGDIPASIGHLTRLQTLDLSYNAFSGRIPVEIGNKLTNLQSLSLGNNGLTDAITGSLGNLSSLKYLDLSISQLEDPIPPELGSIPGLQALFLSDNKLSGVLPQSLYNLSMLETLWLEYNMMSGTIAADIGDRFPRMKILHFSTNKFSGAIPPSISNLSALTIVDLKANGFTGYLPPDLGKLQHLTYLNLGTNRLEANDNQGWEFITSLTNCSQLQYLVLGNNSFSGQLPGSIVNLSTTLQRLYLGDNRISGAIPSNIGNLVGLRLLEMANSSISGAIPESIGKLENLAVLGLYNTSLSGLIPQSIGNLTRLNLLYAYYGNLEGPIPSSLGNLKNLFVLDLSTNLLNGSIPREVLKLPQLSYYLDLSVNSLSGPLPTEVGSLANLNQLILSGNQLSGTIPDSIENCISLVQLLLDRNLFEGTIPQTLKNLKGLALLNLTMNNLSGSIPDALASISDLQQLYLAHNFFSGLIPTCQKGGVFANATALSINGNDGLCGGATQLHLPPCSIPDVEKNKRRLSRSPVVTLTSICALVFLGIVAALIHLIQKRFRQRKASQFISIEIDEPYERVSYHALSNGTGAFSEANLLGQGIYGAVYKCTLHGQGTTTAVKVFNIPQSGSTRSFAAECEALRKVRHRCLIKIITCCSSIDPQGQEFKALVFEFMPNGSLNDWLHPGSKTHTLSNTLSLVQRLDIAVDIMDALDYLHNQCQPPVIHCDLKPSSILLAEDMSARVGDFGISKILPDETTKTLLNSISFTGLRGSIGYVPLEYGEGRSVSTLGDVFSLGILLLEMFTGRSPTDDMFKDSLDLHKYAEAALPSRALEIADPAIWLHEEAKEKDPAPACAATVRSRSEVCLVSVIGLAVSCSKQQPRERMAIRDAAVEMRAIRDAYLMVAASSLDGNLEEIKKPPPAVL